MKNLRNKVSLIGRLGAQPEIVKFDSGSMVARFSIAVNEGFKDKDGNWQDETAWFNINAWGKTAEIVQKVLNKGQEVLLEGRLVTRSYETKEGEKRFATTINMNEFILLTPKNENN